VWVTWSTPWCLTSRRWAYLFWWMRRSNRLALLHQYLLVFRDVVLQWTQAILRAYCHAHSCLSFPLFGLNVNCSFLLTLQTFVGDCWEVRCSERWWCRPAWPVCYRQGGNHPGKSLLQFHGHKKELRVVIILPHWSTALLSDTLNS